MNPILVEMKKTMSSPPKCKDKFIASILNEHGNRLKALEAAEQNRLASKSCLTAHDIEVMDSRYDAE